MKKTTYKENKFPVVFFVFRRPETTKRVLSEIIKSNPPKLYIFADGPRNSDDILMIDKTRKMVDGLLVKKNVNIIKKYRKTNFGLKKSIVEGLNDVFSHEEAAIILEDDCLPSAGFFDFCNMALYSYKNDKKINTLCGTNVDPERGKEKKVIASNYFLPWGWALWKRSWLEYRKINEKELSSISKKSGINKILAWYLLQVYNLSKKGRLSAWSYRMVIMQVIRGKFSLYPPYNTVSNIGFGGSSSNTIIKTIGSELKINLQSKKMSDRIFPYWYNQNYDNQIAYKLYITPVSICGLILRKYFPAVIKRLYRK
jgi:hypothetical protein